jgi:hypothetical protein
MNHTRSENMRHEEERDEGDAFERLLHTIRQGDQHAWAELEQSLGKIVRSWLHDHPRHSVACLFESEEYYVALALDRFQQIMVEQLWSWQTRAEVVVALRVSLQVAILERLRSASRPAAASSPAPGEPGTQDLANESREVWNRLQSLLPAEREQRLVYLLYHCGLSPREIVYLCPGEWNDIQEITRLRCNIMERVSGRIAVYSS